MIQGSLSVVLEDRSEEALLRPVLPSLMGDVGPDGVSSTTIGGIGRDLDTSSSVNDNATGSSLTLV